MPASANSPDIALNNNPTTSEEIDTQVRNLQSLIKAGESKRVHEFFDDAEVVFPLTMFDAYRLIACCDGQSDSTNLKATIMLAALEANPLANVAADFLWHMDKITETAVERDYFKTNLVPIAADFPQAVLAQETLFRAQCAAHIGQAPIQGSAGFAAQPLEFDGDGLKRKQPVDEAVDAHQNEPSVKRAKTAAVSVPSISERAFMVGSFASVCLSVCGSEHEVTLEHLLSDKPVLAGYRQLDQIYCLLQAHCQMFQPKYQQLFDDLSNRIVNCLGDRYSVQAERYPFASLLSLVELDV